MASLEDEDIGHEELEEFEHYLAALETEMKKDETTSTSFSRFFDLPVELRGLVY